MSKLASSENYSSLIQHATFLAASPEDSGIRYDDGPEYRYLKGNTLIRSPAQAQFPFLVPIRVTRASRRTPITSWRVTLGNPDPYSHQRFNENGIQIFR